MNIKIFHSDGQPNFQIHQSFATELRSAIEPHSKPTIHPIVSADDNKPIPGEQLEITTDFSFTPVSSSGNTYFFRVGQVVIFPPQGSMH